MSKLCSIPGCSRPLECRGWCNAHYLSWKAHGDPLGSRTINQRGASKRWLETNAFHFKGDGCLVFPFPKTGVGYGSFRVGKTDFLAHRFVCEATYGPPPTASHQTAHSCGNRGCVNPRHLRWATQKENETDKLTHGTIQRGSISRTSKLTERDVTEIRRLAGKITQVEIAKRFGVKPPAICEIISRKSWSWFDETGGC